VVADLDHPVVPAECVHRWRIGTPHGESCPGTCSLCGAVRSFTNERRPFGQPGRNRRPASSTQTLLLTTFMRQAAGPAFLAAGARADAAHHEAIAE
jgi:hypothetical protein